MRATMMARVSSLGCEGEYRLRIGLWQGVGREMANGRAKPLKPLRAPEQTHSCAFNWASRLSTPPLP